MVKKMLINASQSEECRVAVVADGLLEELDVQVNTREATLGNIYKGVISRIEPSLQAVFVDYGVAKNGFLSINDVHPSYFPESFETGRRRPRIQDVFKRDDQVIVQVNKEERYTKGASLTTNISLAGRYLVLMPGTDLCGVSRKIEDETERKKLKEILQQLKPPEDMGFIIRTAGMGRTKTELSRDLGYLLKLWQSIETQVAEIPAPALLYREHDIVIRSIREHFSPDISEILVDEKEVYKKARDFFAQVMPKYQNLVKLSQEKRPLFNKYQLEEQIEQVYRRRIKLKSGGYIIIEPTEALVTVDVNSGSATKEKGIEDTAFRVNMEAAPEIARQLRLRDLGGIIVIDFIDMMQKKHKQEVEKALKAELKQDRAKTKVTRISTLGLLELSRQRLKSSLGTGEYLECPLCDGRGKVKSPEMAAISTFRKIKSLLSKSNVGEIRVTVPEKVAEYLLNAMRASLYELETLYSTRIAILIRENPIEKDTTFEVFKEEPIEASPMEAAVMPAVMAAPAPLPQAAAEVAEEETQGEDDKKRKRSGRRRRRGGRKRAVSTPEDQDQVLAPERVEDIASEEDQAASELDKPHRFEEELLALVADVGGADSAPDALESPVPSSSQDDNIEGEEAVAEISSSPEETIEEPSPAKIPEAIHAQSPEVPDPIGETGHSVESLSASGSKIVDRPEAPKKEAAPRKITLQSFLPFS